MKRTGITLVVMLSLGSGILFLSGCSKNAITLDKNATVAFDPAKDQPLAPAGGPGSSGGSIMKGKQNVPKGK